MLVRCLIGESLFHAWMWNKIISCSHISITFGCLLDYVCIGVILFHRLRLTCLWDIGSFRPHLVNHLGLIVAKNLFLHTNTILKCSEMVKYWLYLLEAMWRYPVLILVQLESIKCDLHEKPWHYIWNTPNLPIPAKWWLHHVPNGTLDRHVKFEVNVIAFGHVQMDKGLSMYYMCL